MTGIDFDPIGEMGYAISGAKVFCGTFDGQNHSIKNLAVTDQKSAGLFAAISYVVKNVVIDGATINSNHYAGGIVGWTESGPLTKIENCTVKNSTIKSTVEWTGSEWDNGDKVGGITGYTASGPTIIGCTVSDCTVQGYRDIGGLIGYCSTGTITNNTVKNVVINNDRTNGYKPYTADAEYDCNQLIGENAGGTLSGNTTTNVTVVVL